MAPGKKGKHHLLSFANQVVNTDLLHSTNQVYENEHTELSSVIAHSRILELYPIRALIWKYGYRNLLTALGGAYSDDVRDKIIVLGQPETNQIKKIRYFTRFSDSYYYNLTEPLKKIDCDFALLLTLTVDPKNFNSLKQAYRSLQKGWNNLRNAHKHNKSIFREWRGQFVSAVEFQKSGNPHLHILLIDCTWADIDWIRDHWQNKYGIGTFINAKIVERQASGKVINYLLKYISKFQADRDHLSMLWALSAKAVNISRKLHVAILDSLKEVLKLGNWIYLGAFEPESVKDISTYEDFVSWWGSG